MSGETEQRGASRHLPRRRKGRESRAGEAADMPPIELLALEEQFVAAHRVGHPARLADYIRRYLAYASELTEFAARFLSAPEEASGEEETDTGSEQERLSPGAARARDALFGGRRRAEGGPAEVDEETSMRLVAEAPIPYGAPSDGPPDGLLALARRRGLSLRELARRAELTPDLLRWMDAAGFDDTEMPEPLVEDLAAALGATRLEVVRALGPKSDAPRSAGELLAAIRAARDLGEEPRGRWVERLVRVGVVGDDRG